MTSTPSTKTDLRMLDPRKTRLQTDAFGRLQLEIGIEERYAPVRAARCLPLTQPTQFISVQDDEGNEIGIIAEMSDLDPTSQEALTAELELYYLKAFVQAITHVESRNGLITWELVTDLGPKTIHVRDRQHIRPLPNGGTMLTDIHEAKYEIPPIEQLDERSRRCLEIEL